MHSLALAKPSPEAYEVEFLPEAALGLMWLPPATTAQLAFKLHEVARAAAVARGMGMVLIDGVGSTLRLEVGGCVASYVISDLHRTVTVLSLVRAAGT